MAFLPQLSPIQCCQDQLSAGEVARPSCLVLAESIWCLGFGRMTYAKLLCSDTHAKWSLTVLGENDTSFLVGKKNI